MQDPFDAQRDVPGKVAGGRRAAPGPFSLMCESRTWTLMGEDGTVGGDEGAANSCAAAAAAAEQGGGADGLRGSVHSAWPRRGDDAEPGAAAALLFLWGVMANQCLAASLAFLFSA